MDLRVNNKTFQENVFEKFKKLKFSKKPLENECDLNNVKLKLNNVQKFITRFVSVNSPNGILLWHSVGSGKTLTAISLLKKFEKRGYHTLWVTRTTLKKDLVKALDMLPLKNELITVSYKQFSNICNFQGGLYEKLIKRVKRDKPETTDPFYKTIIIIDEAHKLFTEDLKPQEQHDITAIKDALDKTTRTKIILMSATPMTRNPLEMIYLFNMIIKKKDNRFNLESFREDFLDKTGNFTKEGIKLFQEKIKGLVSYVDVSSDTNKFAQVKYTEVLVPLSIPKYSLEDIDTRERACKSELQNCKSIAPTKKCEEAFRRCLLDVKNDKKSLKESKHQVSLIRTKCGIILKD